MVEEHGYHPSTGLRDIVRNYGGWTGTHGVAHIIFGDTARLRLFWSIITTLAFLGMTGELIVLLRLYFSYPTGVDVSVELTKVTFPTTTLCSVNAWKRSGASGTPLEGLITAFEQGRANVVYGFSAGYSEDRVLRAQNWMWLMGEQLIEADRDDPGQLGYTWDELFISCVYDGDDCHEKNFTDFYDPFYGRCYQFNTVGDVNSTRAGPEDGLRLTMRALESDYLPWVESMGIVVRLDDAYDDSFEDAYGSYSPVGVSSNLAVAYVERSKLPAPYNNCTERGEHTSKQRIYYPDNPYNVEACYRSCIQDRVVELCGCYNPKYNAPVNSTAANASVSCWEVGDRNAASGFTFDCTMSIVNFYNSSPNSWDVWRNCDCPQECDLSRYQVSTSLAKWPAPSYQPPDCYRPSIPYWSTRQECLSFYRNSTLQSNIYLSRISVQSKEEFQAYKIIQLLSDIGATLGLWMGMSIACILEWVIFFLLVLWWCLFPPGRVRIDPRYDYFADLKKEGSQRPPELYQGGNEFSLPPTVQDTL